MPLNRKIAFIDLSTGKIEIKRFRSTCAEISLGSGTGRLLLYNHTEPGATRSS